MGWLDNMNDALNYIEEHLQDKMNYEKIAQTACCSPYHFQRTFTFMTGLTLSEYVRRRKMTQAAFELQNSTVKIVDLALKYGYESPEAFSRAFQSLHGVTPTSARRYGTLIKAYPRVSFQFTVKGVQEMNYKIKEQAAFQVYGIEGIFDTKDGEQLREIPAFWQEKSRNGECAKLADSAGFPGGLHAVDGYRKLDGTKFPYMICAMKTALSDTAGYTAVDVPKATWAIFRTENHSGEDTPKEIQSLISRFYSEWLPFADYDLVEGYVFEIYYHNFDGSCFEEVWYRVTAKNR